MRVRFHIEYRDPKTGDWASVEMEFCDAAGISAKAWAEDWAYSAADKGPHVVEEVHGDGRRCG